MSLEVIGRCVLKRNRDFIGRREMADSRSSDRDPGILAKPCPIRTSGGLSQGNRYMFAGRGQ